MDSAVRPLAQNRLAHSGRGECLDLGARALGQDRPRGYLEGIHYTGGCGAPVGLVAKLRKPGVMHQAGPGPETTPLRPLSPLTPWCISRPLGCHHSSLSPRDSLCGDMGEAEPALTMKSLITGRPLNATYFCLVAQETYGPLHIDEGFCCLLGSFLLPFLGQFSRPVAIQWYQEGRMRWHWGSCGQVTTCSQRKCLRWLGGLDRVARRRGSPCARVPSWSSTDADMYVHL